jgi:biopolymer transport protein ExbD
MRRFSQRSHLVTLSEINITPLLDLAFVLLIIFVITTPLLEQGLDLRLAEGGKPDRPLARDDIKTVEIFPRGYYQISGRRLNLDQVEAELVRAYRSNSNLLVYIRADEMGYNKDTYAVIDRCQRNGITRFSLRTQPPTSR